MEMTFRAFIKKYWLQVVAVLCSTAVFLFWIALRVNWAGISKFLGADHNPSFLVMNLPLLISVLMGVILLLTILSFLFIRSWRGPSRPTRSWCTTRTSPARRARPTTDT